MAKTYSEAVMKKKMPKSKMPMKGKKCSTCGMIMK